MILIQFFSYAVLFLAVTVSAVRADDVCIGDEEKKSAQTAVAAMNKAEQAGRPEELFLAYRAIVADECIDRYDKNAQAKAAANIKKLGRDLAKAAEAKGAFYSSEPVRANGQTSAFRYFEAIGDYPEANRVMLKAVHAQSDNIPLFETAWNVDKSRTGPRDPKTGEQLPYASPPAYRQDLERNAAANADRLMKSEEKDAPGLTGSITELSTSATKSLEKLTTASKWMQYLPSGNKPAKDRAEQRGDTIMKRQDPTFSQGLAVGYYEFSGSQKAKDITAKIRQKSDESQRAMEKAGKNIESSITQKNEADQKKFDKKKADLEKELGF